MKAVFLTTLRDERSSRQAFRNATDQLGALLCDEVASHLPKKKIEVETPLGTAAGEVLAESVTLYPILRSGFALLAPFLRFFPGAAVGVIGIRRNEKTAEPEHYYANWPPVKGWAIIIDPMLATGGTAMEAIRALKNQGYPEENILFAGIICSEVGRTRLEESFPKVKTVIVEEDPMLNQQKFIVPGLGDFGDRFFGTDEGSKEA